MKRSFLIGIAGAVAALGFSSAAYAGPFILGGDDADDHGSTNAGGTANIDGWAYNQLALEKIATSSALTNTNMRITLIGVDPNTQASGAVTSSVGFSTTVLHNYAISYVNDSAIDAFFTNTGTAGNNINDASILYIGTGVLGGVDGGMSLSEENKLTTYAATINNFVGAGGGLMSHTNYYAWLSALLPGLTTGGTTGNGQGMNVTAAGMAAFPTLTDADLSTGPYHNTFSNVGSSPVLATESTGSHLATILFATGGSITAPVVTPSTVPEPASWAMMIGGFGLVGAALRRARRSTAVRFA